MADRQEKRPRADVEASIADIAPEAPPGPAPESSGIEVEVHSAPSQRSGARLDRRIHLAQVLADTRVLVDRVLDRISEARIDARRLVTKELWSDPRPEVLNTIVKLACSKVEGALSRELPRHLLTVLTLAEVKVSDLLDARELVREEIKQDSEMLPELRELSTQIQEEITAALDTVSPKLRSHLLQVCNSLTFPEDKVSTAMLLAPRLEMFAQIGATTDLRALVPSLSDDEAKLLKRLTISGSTDNAPGRNCVNSIALRTLMVEDVERWELATANIPVDAEVDVDPILASRINREEEAFHFLSDRLQTTQDSALDAGLLDFANEVGSYRQNLFATYLEFKAAFKGATEGRHCEDASPERATLVTLIEESRSPASRKLDDGSETSDLYMKALAHVNRAEAVVTKAGATPAKAKPAKPVAAEADASPSPGEDVVLMLPAEISNGTRVSVLVGVAIVLACICASLYLPALLSPPRATELDPEIFGSAYVLTEVVAAGGVMVARVSEWSWNDLSPAERLAKMEELGAIARTHHVKGAVLVAPDGRELAQWNRATGAKLVDPAP